MVHAEYICDSDMDYKSLTCVVLFLRMYGIETRDLFSDWVRSKSTSSWVHKNHFLQLSRDGNLHGTGVSHVTTSSPKPSFRAPWRVGDAVVGRGNAGWATSKSGHPWLLTTACRRKDRKDLCWIVCYVWRPSRSRNWTELNWIHGTSVYSLIQRTSVAGCKSAQSFDSGQIAHSRCAEPGTKRSRLSRAVITRRFETCAESNRHLCSESTNRHAPNWALQMIDLAPIWVHTHDDSAQHIPRTRSWPSCTGRRHIQYRRKI